LRRRCAAYPFHHILYGSSLNFDRKGNPQEDPALIVYKESNQCIWVMEDENGKEFQWEMGDKEETKGIKWSDEARKKDGGWDLNAVRDTAYFVTPSGAIIKEADRMRYTRAGRWRATNPTGARRGYKIVAPMLPFADTTFGELASRFVEAKYSMHRSGSKVDRSRNTLRTYFAEFWASAYQDEEIDITEDRLSHCALDYAQGEVRTPEGDEWNSGVFATVDVQKSILYYTIRSWSIVAGSDLYSSSLITFGIATDFDMLDDIIGKYQPSIVGIDIAYALRHNDVADYCAKYTDSHNPKDSRVIALRGSDSAKDAITWHIKDATEGRSVSGDNPYLELTWNVDIFRSALMDEMNTGERWHIPSKWSKERDRDMYMSQVTSTRKVDGEWVRSYTQDHIFDCEVQQLILARWDAII
jgi:hypothetical protein